MTAIATARNEAMIAPARRRGRPTAVVSPQLLSVSRKPDADGGVTLRIIGQLDLTTVLSFRNDAFTVLGERPAYIALDLTHVAIPDTDGISTLVTFVRVARMVQVPVRILASDRLNRLMEAMRLDRLLEDQPATGEEIAARVLLR